MLSVAKRHNSKCFLSERSFQNALSQLSPLNASLQIPIMPNISLQLTHLMLSDAFNLHLFDKQNKFCVVSKTTETVQKLERSITEPICTKIIAPYILANGSLIPCCYSSNAEGLIMGKISKNPNIFEILRSEKYKALFKNLANNKLVYPVCKTCKGIDYHRVEIESAHQ